MSIQHAYDHHTEPAMPLRLRKGERVLFAFGVNLSPHTYVMAGEKGTVVWANPLTGDADIELDQRHRGLAEWDNCVSIVSPEHGGDTRDIEEAIYVIGASP